MISLVGEKESQMKRMWEKIERFFFNFSFAFLFNSSELKNQPMLLRLFSGVFFGVFFKSSVQGVD